MPQNDMETPYLSELQVAAPWVSSGRLGEIVLRCAATAADLVLCTAEKIEEEMDPIPEMDRYSHLRATMVSCKLCRSSIPSLLLLRAHSLPYSYLCLYYYT